MQHKPFNPKVLSQMTEGQIEALRKALAERSRAFEAKNARRYSDYDVAADASWADQIARYRALRMEVHRQEAIDAGITQGLKGGCQFFITRRRRFCSNMAAVGSTDSLCHEHSAGQFDSQIAKPKSYSEDIFPKGWLEPGREQETPKGGKKVGHRMHYMVNPFSMPEARPAEDWQNVFGDLTKPLLLDVGCAKGRWLGHMAAETSVRLELAGKTYNYCGVEIYGPLVEQANLRISADPKRNLHNLHYVHANIKSSLKSLQFPNLHTVCFQFCDPWLKKVRRRTVDPKLAATIAELLPCGGQVYVVSDYLELATEMRSLFLATGFFAHSAGPSCNVVPVEAAAVAALINRRACTVGRAEGAEACDENKLCCKISSQNSLHHWQRLPSVVSWSAQVCVCVCVRACVCRAVFLCPALSPTADQS
jgi:tRNA (guanine-N7-)-methyltransferase